MGFCAFSWCLLFIRLQTGSGRLSARCRAAWREHQSPAGISHRPARHISSFSAIRHTLVPCPCGSDVQLQRSECCLQALLISCQSEGETQSLRQPSHGRISAFLSRQNTRDSVCNFLPSAQLDSAFMMIHQLYRTICTSAALRGSKFCWSPLEAAVFINPTIWACLYRTYSTLMGWGIEILTVHPLGSRNIYDTIHEKVSDKLNMAIIRLWCPKISDQGPEKRTDLLTFVGLKALWHNRIQHWESGYCKNTKLKYA